jgi:hypothetical protein
MKNKLCLIKRIFYTYYDMVVKLNMVINPKDEEKINLLKERYGLTRNSELVRFVITHMAEQIPKKEN